MYSLVDQDSGTDGNPHLLQNTLLANTPQLLLSTLYFTFNSIFTSEMINKEWIDFAHKRKPLRVTQPQGEQKSTFWLSLPYRYSIPLIGVSALLHWLFSQAIFLVDVQFFNPFDKYNINREYYSLNTDQNGSAMAIIQCGWSPIAAIVSIVAIGLTVIAAWIFGCRRYRAGPPLVGACSVAIVASCHREPDEDEDIVFKPLKWGVTSCKDGVGHCTLSARDVEWPDEQTIYR